VYPGFVAETLASSWASKVAGLCGCTPVVVIVIGIVVVVSTVLIRVPNWC
jgi:hypothetical protein